MRQFTDPDSALLEARIKAQQIASGRADMADLTRNDRDELQEARKIADGVPLVSAIQEWAKAKKLTAGQIIPAAEQWARTNSVEFESIDLRKAVDRFITAKTKAGKQGEITYRSRLEPLVSFFGAAVRLDEITSRQLGAYLEQFQNAVTRNDMRKRAVALFNWAQRSAYLPRGVQLEIEHTERAKEQPTEIGILTPAEFKSLLEWFRDVHPKYLGAVVLAGFCGIRIDEVQGKKQDRSKRQIWEDIDMKRKFVRVTTAKTNTPAWRLVPLCDAAIDWLMLCENREGSVCPAGGLETARILAKRAGKKIPANAFRHSFISYQIARTGDKAATATMAGNSVAEIDRRYRVPLTPEDGSAWFEIRPNEIAPVIKLKKRAND